MTQFQLTNHSEKKFENCLDGIRFNLFSIISLSSVPYSSVIALLFTLYSRTHFLNVLNNDYAFVSLNLVAKVLVAELGYILSHSSFDMLQK